MEDIIKVIPLGIMLTPLAHALALVAIILLVKLHRRTKHMDAKIDGIMTAIHALQKDKN
jgi:hypothetical protein